MHRRIHMATSRLFCQGGPSDPRPRRNFKDFSDRFRIGPSGRCVSLAEQAKVSHSGPTWPGLRRARNSKESSRATRALTFNEPRPDPSKSRDTKKIEFRLHEALFFLSAIFLKSRQASLLRVAGRRHDSALALGVFSGGPGLAAGRP